MKIKGFRMLGFPQENVSGSSDACEALFLLFGGTYQQHKKDRVEWTE